MGLMCGLKEYVNIVQPRKYSVICSIRFDVMISGTDFDWTKFTSYILVKTTTRTGAPTTSKFSDQYTLSSSEFISIAFVHEHYG